jgi:hypothetical protein
MMHQATTSKDTSGLDTALDIDTLVLSISGELQDRWSVPIASGIILPIPGNVFINQAIDRSGDMV